MEYKKIIFDDEARNALQRGVNVVADAVRKTLGPKGKYVISGRQVGKPDTTNDGVTIAKKIDLEDQFENIGAQLIKEVASKTNDVSGDGTTTATILAQAIINEGIRNITAGANSIYLKNGIELATKKIIKEVKKMSTPVTTNDEIKQIATISANDDEIGELIAQAMEKVGKDGIITVEEGGIETTLKVTEGMEIDRGYLSPYFVTGLQKEEGKENLRDRMEAVYDDVYILIINEKLSSMQEFLPLLEKIAHEGKPFLIIAEEIVGEPFKAMVVNKMRGILKVVAIKAPGFGDRRKERLEDIAILTGGTVISSDIGVNLEDATLDMLGHANKIIVKKDTTTIVVEDKDEERKSKVQERIGQLKNLIETTDVDFDKRKYQERLAKLSGGIAVISAGAATESELRVKKYKIEDAINATKSAVEEGIVIGGGVAYLRAISNNTDPLDWQMLRDSEKVGVDIVFKALEYPLRQIIANLGGKPDVVLNNVIKEGNKNPNIGYDAKSEAYVDMIQSGIVDPTKVVRTALENASSIACLVLVTETLISDDIKKEK